MTRLETRIQKLYESPRSVSSDELISILVSLGFELRGKKTRHGVYRHPKLPHIRLVIPDQNPLKEVYVKKVRGVIEELRELEDDG